MVCTNVPSHPDSIFILLPMPSYAFSMFHFLHLFRSISCRHCLSILSFPSFFPISISAFPPSSGLSLCLILERSNLTLFNLSISDSYSLILPLPPSLTHSSSLSLSDSHSLFLSLSPSYLSLTISHCFSIQWIHSILSTRFGNSTLLIVLVQLRDWTPSGLLILLSSPSSMLKKLNR